MQSEVQKLAKIHNSFEEIMDSLEKSEFNAISLNRMTMQNNKLIFSNLRKLVKASLVPLHIILCCLDQTDLLNFASSCKSIYRIVYSPFGYKMLTALRPIVVQIPRPVEEPILNIATFDFGSDKVGSFEDDDDDLEAVIMTMNTNILAMMHKAKQIDAAKRSLNVKSRALVSILSEQAKAKEAYLQKNVVREQKLQKLESVGKDCEKHLRDLVDEQNKLFKEKLTKLQVLKAERDKLLGQKELLIKKLKALAKQIQDEQVISKEAREVLQKIELIVRKKPVHSSQKQQR